MNPALPEPFDENLKVLVLAGSNPLSDRRRRLREARRARGEPEVPMDNKAFVPLRGRLVIEYLLDTLQDCGLHRVWILAQEHSLRRLPARYSFSPLPQEPGATLVANLSRAYSELELGPDEPVLVVFADHPFTTPTALRSFLRACAAQWNRGDFFHGFVLSEAYAAYSPFFRRTSVHLREMCGRASGLNLAVPSRLHRLRLLDELYDIRKQEKVGAFLGLLRRLIVWLGARSPFALFDCSVLWLAKELEKAGRRGGIRGRAARAFEAIAQRIVPARRVEGYGARILQAETGARLVPLAHGGSAIDVDFAEELAMLEEHWEPLRELCAREDAQLREDAQRDSTSISSL